MISLVLGSLKTFIPLQFREQADAEGGVPEIIFEPATLEDRMAWNKSDRELAKRERDFHEQERQHLAQLMKGLGVKIRVSGAKPGVPIQVDFMSTSDLVREEIEAKRKREAEVERARHDEAMKALEEGAREDGLEEEDESLPLEDLEAFSEPESERYYIVCDEQGEAEVVWMPALHYEQFPITIQDIEHHLATALKYIRRVKNVETRNERGELVPFVWSTATEEDRRRLLLSLGTGKEMLKNLIELAISINLGLGADEKKH